MSRDGAGTGFFVGYRRMPAPLALFAGLAAAVLLGLAIGAGLFLALAQQDPGPGRWAWDLGYQRLSGVLQARPYPMLRLPPGPEADGPRTILLVGQGKRGADPAGLDGQAVDLGGIFIIREQTSMLQMGGKQRLQAAEDPGADLAGYAPAPDRALGPHTLKGEIVDSKCYLGAMKPGRLKTHMGCANLCLIGGIPPLFVVERPQGPPDLLLLADRDGGPVTEPLLDHVSLFVELSGEVWRRDDQLIFRIDPDSLRVL